MRPKMSSSSHPSRRTVSVVVRLTGDDLVGAEELLEEHDAGELVGQRHRAEREPVVDAVGGGAVAERAAEDEAQVAALAPALLEETAEGDRVQPLPTGIEDRDEGPVGNPPGHVFVLPDLDEL